MIFCANCDILFLVSKMFGYVRVNKDELKVREYNVYKSYYCGLCKTLKSEYGYFSRFGLNYDSVFLALLLSSVTEDSYHCENSRCIAHPAEKKPIMKTNRCLSYSAAAMVILALLKLEDDIHDEHSIKAALTYFLLTGAKRKVKKRYGELYNTCRSQINKLSELEKNKVNDIDKLSDVFANLLKILFVPDFIDDETTARILSHIGYTLGRFIYIIDAYEDIEKDKKKKSFNPFLLGETPQKEALSDTLTFSLSSLANSYELLDLKINKPILDNIIYLGLSGVLDKTIEGEIKNA